MPTLPLPANHQSSYHGVSPNQGRGHAHLQPPHPVELLQKGCAESRQGHGAHQTQIWTLSILVASSGANIPISSILLCKGAGRRKVSSLQDRVSVPTNSEFVANILALSSDRFTPAIDATSLMSSSSLERRGAEDYVVRGNHSSLRWFQFGGSRQVARNQSADLFSTPAEGMKPPLLHSCWKHTLTETCSQNQAETTVLRLPVPRTSREDLTVRKWTAPPPMLALKYTGRQSLPKGASPWLLELVLLCSSCLCRNSRKGFGSR